MNKIELKVLPDRKLIPTAVAAIKEYAKLYFDDEKDIFNIGLSLEEAIANVTEFLMGNRESYIEVSANGENGQFIITVTDFELPGDIRKTLKDEETIGLSVMESLMDNVKYENLGRNGRRQTLTKNYYATPKIEDIKNEVDEPEGFKHTYEIRPPKEEEMIEIVRLLYDAYGETHDVDGVYFPEFQWNRILNDDAYFLVAVAENGEIAANFALTRVGDLPGIWDFAMGVTKGKYRKGGLMKKLASELMAYAKNRQDIKGLFTEATVLHPYTQLAFNHFDFVSMGYTLSVTPADLFQTKTARHEGRASFAIAMKILQDKPKTIHVLDDYKEFVQDLCNKLGIDRTIITDEPHFIYENTVTEEEFVKFIDVGYNHVLQIGNDYKDVFRNIDINVRKKGGLTNEIYVPLDDPAAILLMEELLKNEYFPVRYLPCPDSLDYMVFTKMYSDPVQYEEIATVSPFTEMLETIKSFDPMQNKL